ncbi:docking protein 2 [Nematostella vectensis]|uniref:docking protein 2 n=1 Tax=Nematostella vectensis TaxID=45351 RepID=UPI0020773D52|nr:docking protein 2 [Nematostella vectensis]
MKTVGMASYEGLVKCGYLEMKLPRKQRKVTHKVWKRKWFVLRRKSKRGNTRLEYYHSEKACIEGKHRTVIPLDKVTGIHCAHSRTHTQCFLIAAIETKIFLSGENELETYEWIRLMKELVLPEPKMMPLVQGGDIFGLYEVTIERTDDSERLNLVGEYLVTVRKNFLCLHNIKSGEKVLEWELEFLPSFRLVRLSYLQDMDKLLVIKAAKGCKTGEGEYHFLTRQGREILETIKCQTHRLYMLRHRHGNEATNRRHSVDSAACTRSSGNDTNDSMTSSYETDSRGRSISTSSHQSSHPSSQQSVAGQSSGPTSGSAKT